MNRFIAALALPFCFSTQAHALDCESKSTGRIGYSLCRVDLTDSPKLYLQDENGKAFKNFSSLDHWLTSRHKKLLFAMNAGMYHRNYSPVGLFIAEGQKNWPINLADGSGNFFLQPNGVFAITHEGAQVTPTMEFKLAQENIVLATQSGPLLLIDGQVNANFQKASQSRFIRNGVCAPTGQQMIFVITDVPVNFYEFALIFRDHLGCKDALYFDGAVSSLYATQLHRHDQHASLGPMIVVVE